VNLIAFIEQLTRKEVNQRYTKNPRLKVHKITNCFLALKFLQDLGVKKLTISAEDIVDANENNETSVNLMLGFCWGLLRQLQVTPEFEDSAGSENKENTFEMRMLDWCRNLLSSYEDIVIESWDSFQDGKALLALVEQFDSSLVNYRGFDKSDPMKNAKHALQLAEEKIKIPSELIDPEELVTGQISDKNLVLYSTLFYNAFSDKNSLTSRESLIRRLHQLEEQIEVVLGEKEGLEYKKTSLEEKKSKLTNELDIITTERDEILNWKSTTLEEIERERKSLQERILELEENLNMLQFASSDSTTRLQQINEKIKNERDDLMKNKIRLKNDKEEVGEKLSTLSKNYGNEKKDRENLEEVLAKQQSETGSSLANLRKKVATICIRFVISLVCFVGY